jgi:cytochrome o ubiquinol oxidase subunit 2
MKNNPFFIIIPLLFGGIGLLLWYLQGKTVAILQPAGLIANQQRDLFVFTALLGLFMVLLVFAFLIFTVIRYREGNDATDYRPNWNFNPTLSLLWLALTVVVIAVVGVASWKTTHALDPYRPIAHAEKPLIIQVVSLQWKWLFLYPEQQIASVNLVAFPEKRPVQFQLTSDAPMNSFWIPQLAGQIYTMEGMVTKLNIMADTTGEYQGSPAEISGEGFADMMFTAKSMSSNDFDEWVLSAKASSAMLDSVTYESLAKPGDADRRLYSSYQPSLYTDIVNKFMPDMTGEHDMETAVH